MVNLISTVFYAVTAMSIASTMAAPLPNPEPDYEVRAFDDYELEARALPIIADTMLDRRSLIEFDERSNDDIISIASRSEDADQVFGRELEERSKAGDFFKKAFKTVTGIVRRDESELESRDLEERSKVGKKIGNFFKKAFKTVTSIVRRGETELESRDLEERSKAGKKIGNFFKKAFKTVTSVVRRDEEQAQRRGLFGVFKTAAKGIEKGVEAAVKKGHHKHAAKAASAPQPSQSKRAYLEDEYEY